MPRSEARRRDRFWLAAVLGSAAVAVVLSTLVAPTDAVQGPIQRLMYLHAPAAWSAYLCFALVLLGSVWYLKTRNARADRLARAAAEAGIDFTAITLLTGSIWGAGTWGTAWVWDARVTTTVAMGLIYLGYLALRGALGGERGRRAAAMLGTGGFAIVPIVHFSVLWWRTLHQPPTVLAPSLTPPLHELMGLALGVSFLAFTVFTVWLLRWRIAVLRRNSDGATSAGVAGLGSDLADSETNDALPRRTEVV
ncbi:cytochrome c biogenesis protein CcsA [Salinibacterium sp. SYSU T00001]|uniref:cytochrome c biogenesis protein CcsA n=1 Tax=Homoserinimonas sedimenticola TaxID=2986805 RepID=UPI0022367F62|nr:cytochrome c biogenesis protein CcsA [Salinibacterium sedimenticola]MCW4384780.1 cytochrome c biogenesis protein CcsA [Salinibacterium sedimenticola]